MISPNQRRIILWTLLIGIIILILWFLIQVFYHPKPKNAPTTSTPTTEQTPSSANSLSQQLQKQEQASRTATADVLSLAKQFVARYGSYSNESVFENIRDVMPLMSKAFQQKTDMYLAASVAPKEYYGVTTRVLTAKTTASNDEIATVKLTTQREESLKSPQNKTVKYQDILVSFVKESGVWKIDSATWQ